MYITRKHLYKHAVEAAQQNLPVINKSIFERGESGDWQLKPL